MLFRKFLLIALIVLLMLTLSGCNLDQSTEKQLRVASLGSPITLNPLYVRDGFSAEAVSLLFESLLKSHNETLEMEPALVYDWEIEDEGKTYLLYFRENLYWSDGEPLTARDAEFTLRVMCHPDFTGHQYALYYHPIVGAVEYHQQHDSSLADGHIHGVEVLDEHTLKITLEQALAPFLTYLEFQPLPEHVLGEVPVAEIEGHEYSRWPEVTSGPYVLEEWETDEYLKMTGNQDFYRGSPEIEEVYYRIIPNQEAQLIEMLNGNLELIPTAVKLEDVKDLKDNPEIEIHSNLRLVYDYLGFNMRKDDSPLQEREVRRALSMILDREALVEDVLLGYGEVLHGPLVPLQFPYDPDFESFSVDLERAREILEETGYEDGFELDLIINAGNQVRENAALMFKEAASETGVEVNIQVLEWQAFMEAGERGDYDLIISGQGTGVDPDLTFNWHSQSPLNELGYANSRVDELIEEALVTLEEEERSKIYRQAQEVIVADAPMVWLYTREAVHASTSRLDNFTPHPENAFYNIDQWKIE
ncbi:MAG: hypothetical protein D5R97_00935 [Candidatus Syntrophonatronum acetioxidans]|uniref:Solute-binding protein family 5 domain-containing protein n=1 Tax=Candidatus Syntrophonatronum acetioxidans TaxID=1795816 RepID=A0A424YIE5_9FIRM|nr:MAG: hypothetical protein D5R97_00935 [Candidatus Syntrophonatronum acetioxidans]